jgi:hypothetical protein
MLMRAGLAFVFLYPAVNALSNPDSWIGYFPRVLRDAGIPEEVLLHGFGAIEVVLALWLLSGWKIFWPALLAAVSLGVIVVVNPNQFEVLFRDVGLAALALGLAVHAWHTENR